MTRKDYKLIAHALAVASDGMSNPSYTQIVAVLATALQSDNPRFDRARFYTACGIN